MRMAARIGQFQNDEARARFTEAYERLESAWPLPCESRVVQTSFGSTYVRVTPGGSGLPLVLLHPLQGTSLAWASVIAALAADRTVFAPDSIGTAGRSIQTAPLTSEQQRADWLDEVICGLGIDRAHLLGYSNGTVSVLAGLIHKPQRIATAALIEPTLVKPRLGTLLRFAAAGAFPSKRRLDRLSAWLSPGVQSTPDERALAGESLRAYRSRLPWAAPPTDDELLLISRPTSVLLGAESVLANPGRTATRAHRIPNARVETYSGLGHGMLFQEPDRVLRDITVFFRCHDSDQ
jgi:pimeloyl-ACP methyl ester carboxylesterase